MTQEETNAGHYIPRIGSYVRIKVGDKPTSGRWEVIHIDPLDNYYLANDKLQLSIKKLDGLVFDGHPPKMWEDVYFPYAEKPMLVRDLFR